MSFALLMLSLTLLLMLAPLAGCEKRIEEPSSYQQPVVPLEGEGSPGERG